MTPETEIESVRSEIARSGPMAGEVIAIEAGATNMARTGPVELDGVPDEDMESVASIMSRLVFNWNGTIPAEQLEGVPQDLVDRITSPEFVAQAKKQIQLARGLQKSGQRESRLQVPFHSNGEGLNRKQRRLLGLHKIPPNTFPVRQLD